MDASPSAPIERSGWTGTYSVSLTVVKQDGGGSAAKICIGEEVKLTASAHGQGGGVTVSITIFQNEQAIAGSSTSPLIKENHNPGGTGTHEFQAQAVFSHPSWGTLIR
jgi:hypothetical protein